MKAVIFIIVILLLVAAGWYFMQPSSLQEENNTPTTDTTTESAPVTDDAAVEMEGEMSTESEAVDTSVSAEEAAMGTKGEGVELEADTAVESDVTAEPTVREFTIDSFNYGYSMDEIRVNEGDTVTINLTNSGGFHDWVVNEFGAATDQIQAGDTTSVTFVADAAGTYEYYCSVGSHRAQGMVGQLIVE